MKRISLLLWVVCGLILISGCAKNDKLEKGCVKARYLRVSDSPCGGTDKIEIIQGGETILSLFPNLESADSLIITANVPENLKAKNTVFYFTAKIAAPKICNAMVAWYPEIELIGISEKACF